MILQVVDVTVVASVGNVATIFVGALIASVAGGLIWAL
jgi:hypothetical protein